MPLTANPKVPKTIQKINYLKHFLFSSKYLKYYLRVTTDAVKPKPKPLIHFSEGKVQFNWIFVQAAKR